MSTNVNPFTPIFNELAEMKKLLLSIKNAPKEDYSLKYYTRKEVADLTNSSVQSVDNYIEKGWIQAQNFGPKKILIHHYQIFSKEDNSLINFKYKRKA
ncbi:hypothetical protein [Nonlabens sp. Asnod2-A12]|uniref:hypothetical protein n=1 Tax=Nonlabens sp. Asnod2-A12 TaxID=3160578 RepID=UPI0038673459